MLMDCSAAAVTVNEKAFEVTPLKLAVMLALPIPAPVARPAVLIATTAGEVEAQVTWVVRFAVLESLYVPVAVNWPVAPLGMEELGAVTAIDFRIAAVTSTLVAPLIEPKVAVTVEVPTAEPVTRPWSPLALPTVASEVEDQDATAVKSLVVLSL